MKIEALPNKVLHLTQLYANASLVANDRAVFNIKDNQYRLIVAVQYAYGIVYIHFVGTHTAYNHVDATTMWEHHAMDIRPIRTGVDDQVALTEIERLVDAQPGTSTRLSGFVHPRRRLQSVASGGAMPNGVRQRYYNFAHPPRQSPLPRSL